jgi:hypothetical protein
MGRHWQKNNFGESTSVGYIKRGWRFAKLKQEKIPFMIKIALPVYHESPCLSMISFRSSSDAPAARNTVVGPQPRGDVATRQQC